MPIARSPVAVLMLAAVVVLLLTGCALRRTDRAYLELFGRVDDLVRQGCYDCLLEARDTLEPLAVAGRGAAAALTRLFEIQLLIVLRHKELAIDTAAEMDRARTLAARMPHGTDTGRYLASVDAVPPDMAGTPRDERSVFAAGMPDRRRIAHETLTWLQQQQSMPLLNDYLAIAVQCTLLTAPTGTEDVASAEIAAVPLLAYRRGICEQGLKPAALEQVLDTVPRAVEVGLFLARAEMGTLSGSDGSRLLALLRAAYARVPSSTAVMYQLGMVTQALGDCRSAVAYYSEILLARPGHEDARLGRTICFSYLNQPAEAIADATILIDRRAPNQGDAYYWRAWNRHRRAELEAARADIDRAKTLRYASHVLTLAGIIEHDQADLDIAREDLTTAAQLDGTNCSAHWYLGLVEYRAERWRESAGAFAGSAGCYAASASTTEKQREMMIRRTDLDAGFRARQIAGFDAAIREDRSQESASALNAALNYARAGDRGSATEYLERAAADPQRREKVEELRRALAALP